MKTICHCRDGQVCKECEIVNNLSLPDTSCYQCELFKPYEDGEDRKKDNCTKWLCNDGECPLDKMTEGNK